MVDKIIKKEASGDANLLSIHHSHNLGYAIESSQWLSPASFPFLILLETYFFPPFVSLSGTSTPSEMAQGFVIYKSSPRISCRIYENVTGVWLHTTKKANTAFTKLC